MLDVVTYKISNIENLDITVESNEYLLIKEFSADSATIEGIKIGNGKIIVKKENSTIYEKEISVESIWMEG